MNHLELEAGEGSKTVGIMGGIASGKTTLCKNLKDAFITDLFDKLSLDNLHVLFEIPNESMLKEFYNLVELAKTKNQPEIAHPITFLIQMDFLAKRLTNNRKVLESKNCLFLYDRTFYEDWIFPQDLIRQGLMSDQQYGTYMRFFNEYKRLMVVPDLMIWLDVTPEKAFGNLKKRGTDNITLDYLERHYEMYEKEREIFKKKFGDKFFILDNNDYVDVKDVVELINDNLTMNE